MLVFFTRTMPDWCGHAWPTGPGQNESQEGPEPVHLSKNTRTVERLLKPTRTVERFATSRPLASAGRSIIPPAISRATPCPCTPLGRSCVKGRARADSRHHRRRRRTGPRGVRYLLTADGRCRPHVCTRDGIIGSSASPRFVVAGYIISIVRAAGALPAARPPRSCRAAAAS